MAISECPSRETHPAADISLIAENRGVTLAELGFRFTRGLRGRNNGEPQLSTPTIPFPAMAAKVLSLGFGFGLICVLGKQRVVEWKTMLRTYAVGHWGFGVVSDLR